MTEAERVLRELLDDIASKEKYENYNTTMKPISSEGANYTSQLYLATISAAGKEDLDLFAKVAIIGEKMRQHTAVSKLYSTEEYVYTKLGKIYERMQNERGVPEDRRLVMPKFYGCNAKFLEETVVLENLVAKGFTTYDRFKSIDWEYASRAVEELAKLHALSIAYGEENPEEYAEALKLMKFEMGEYGDDVKAVTETMVGSALSVLKEENRDRLKKYLDANIMKMPEFRNPVLCPILLHGDYRPSNLMHKVNCDGKLQVIIIDYQTLHAGCGVTDLLYFVFNGSDREFRKQHYSQLVEHYYTQLCLALRTLDVDPDAVYPRKDFDYELKKMLPYGLFIALFVLQFVTVDAANAPKMDGDMAAFAVKTSDLFADRLNEIVEDYIEWGVL